LLEDLRALVDELSLGEDYSPAAQGSQSEFRVTATKLNSNEELPQCSRDREFCCRACASFIDRIGAGSQVRYFDWSATFLTSGLVLNLVLHSSIQQAALSLSNSVRQACNRVSLQHRLREVRDNEGSCSSAWLFSNAKAN
jgi:hypothetical protein